MRHFLENYCGLAFLSCTPYSKITPIFERALPSLFTASASALYPQSTAALANCNLPIAKETKPMLILRIFILCPLFFVSFLLKIQL